MQDLVATYSSEDVNYKNPKKYVFLTPGELMHILSTVMRTLFLFSNIPIQYLKK